jgi:hypothetical protein
LDLWARVATHEREQWTADVRADSSPDEGEDFLPEALRRSPTPPLTSAPGGTRRLKVPIHFAVKVPKGTRPLTSG